MKIIHQIWKATEIPWLGLAAALPFSRESQSHNIQAGKGPGIGISQSTDRHANSVILINRSHRGN